MASPKHHVPKRYVVTTKHAVDDAAISALLTGVVLNDDPEAVAAVACERVSVWVYDEAKSVLTCRCLNTGGVISKPVTVLHRNAAAG